MDHIGQIVPKRLFTFVLAIFLIVPSAQMQHGIAQSNPETIRVGLAPAGKQANGGGLLSSPRSVSPGERLLEKRLTAETEILVTTLDDTEADDGLCSIREAVKAANQNTAQGGCPAGSSATDWITFSVSGTIVLSGELNVTGGPLIIDGSGETVSISGGNASRVFSLDSGANVFLADLSIINGKAADGGAIYNGGYLWVENSTLSGNQAVTGSGRGGAIYNSGTTVLNNSTLSTNQAISGGGVYNTASLYISSATLTNNSASSSGGGIYSQNHYFYYKNTILAKNTAVSGPDCYGNNVVSSGYNLLGKWNGCSAYPTTGDLIGISPLLGSLQDNGGPSSTHALLFGSLAIDHGNPNGCYDYDGYPVPGDQRGLPRSGRCDVGAYEFRPEIAAQPYHLFLPGIQRRCSSVLFFDDFSVRAHAWKVEETSSGLYQYLGGEYRIKAKTAVAWEGSFSGYKATDYVLEVDVRNATGVPGPAGFFFEFKDDWTQFYVFLVDTDGNYIIFRYDSNNSAGGYSSHGYSPFIHLGTASNHLKLERYGSQIWAYANGELLTVFPDASTTEARSVGLMTIADPTPNVDARYDNFTVESIRCGASYSYPLSTGLAADDKPVELTPPDSWEVTPPLFRIDQ